MAGVRPDFLASSRVWPSMACVPHCEGTWRHQQSHCRAPRSSAAAGGPTARTSGRCSLRQGEWPGTPCRVGGQVGGTAPPPCSHLSRLVLNLEPGVRQLMEHGALPGPHLRSGGEHTKGTRRRVAGSTGCDTRWEGSRRERMEPAVSRAVGADRALERGIGTDVSRLCPQSWH